MPKIFVAVHGQNDNIGDSILRRAMLATFEDSALERHVLVGHHGGDYQSALGLRPDDVVYATRKEWQTAAFAAAARGRIGYVSNAGEIQMNSRRIRISSVDAALVALIRLRGGIAMQTGMGIRQTSGRRPFPVDLVARLCQLATWRDQPSRDHARVGEVYPDWAFLEGREPQTLRADVARERRFLAVTMRGDRPAPPAHWIEAVRTFADEQGLEIITVTQVVRDSQRSVELAEALGGTAHTWDGGDHHEQEAAVRAIYRDTAAIISDRLHALVLGLTEGAVPIGYTVGAPEKVERTFAGAGMPGIGFSQLESTSAEAAARMATLLGRRDELIDALDGARARIVQLRGRMLALAGKLR